MSFFFVPPHSLLSISLCLCNSVLFVFYPFCCTYFYGSFIPHIFSPHTHRPCPQWWRSPIAQVCRTRPFCTSPHCSVGCGCPAPLCKQHVATAPRIGSWTFRHWSWHAFCYCCCFWWWRLLLLLRSWQWCAIVKVPIPDEYGKKQQIEQWSRAKLDDIPLFPTIRSDYFE